MPFFVTCPRCRRTLRGAAPCEGRLVACPACGAVFEAVPSGREVACVLPGVPAPVAARDPGPQAVTALPEGTYWTARDGWQRVRAGLGWAAAGMAIALSVLFLQHLPMLLRLVGAELVEFNGDERPTFQVMLGRTVGLLILAYSGCLALGLLQCALYPVRGRGQVLTLAALAAFFVWAVGWLYVGADRILDPGPLASREWAQTIVRFLNWTGLLQQAAFVLFLRELGRECGSAAVAARLRELLVLVACFVGVIGVAAWLGLGLFGEVVAFVGLFGAQVQLLRLVLASREAAGRRGAT